MFRQLQVTDDLRAQQTHHVRELGKFEAGDDLFGHGRPADDVPAFEHHDFLARHGKIGRGNESVMPRADHDCVIIILCHINSPFTRLQV